MVDSSVTAMDLRPLETTKQVIDALGGNAAVRELTGLRSPQAVWEYVNRGSFPPKTFVVMQKALTDRGFSAPSSLWQMLGEHGDAEH